MNLPKPLNYKLMIELSEKLAGFIPFIRDDFYEVGDKVLSEKLTFFPGSGMEVFYA